MKAIILVAGYATRLYPLTKDTPKSLLLVNNKPIIDYIISGINSIHDIDEIILVSNNKFYNNFLQWSKTANTNKKITIINDGTNDEETRLGAIGDIKFCIDELNIDEDVMIIAGDNLFTYEIKDVYDYFKKHNKDVVCTKEINNIEMLKSFAVATLNGKNVIKDLEEKPQRPKSNVAVYATYMYKKETIALFDTYIKEGNNIDAPGYFLQYLHKIKDVLAYKFDGDCYDIGTLESYEEIQKVIK